MDNVVYSASSLVAFSGGLAVTAFMLVLGIIGVFWVVFKRREKLLARIGMGCASLVLLLAGIGVTVNLARIAINGQKTVVVVVNEKKEVVSNCGDSNRTCTSYLLETQADKKMYDFTVARSAFDRVEVNACYQVTYYPARSLFGESLQEVDYSEFYEASATITRIERLRCP